MCVGRYAAKVMRNERSEMESFRTFSSLELVRANACNRFVSIVHSSGMRQHQIAFFIYNRNYPDSVENPPIGTETKAVAAIGDGFGFKFHFWWDFTYILHKLVLFHEKSLYLQKQDYQFH